MKQKTIFYLILFSLSHIYAQEITLESCDSWVNSTAPAFFQKYFDCSDITVNENYIVLHTDGLPPHQSWYYQSSHPNHIAYVSQGNGYYQNPNTIADHNFNISIPHNPIALGITIDESLVDGNVNSSNYEYPMGLAGIALDGVALFNPLAAPGHDIADEQYSFDYYSAHPTNNGMYHYHTSTKGPLEVLENLGLVSNTIPGSAEIEVYGIMCDGTIVLGCTELDGSSPDNSDFDAQSGHLHDLVDEVGITHFTNRYHTHVCPGMYTHDFTPEIRYYDSCYRQSLSIIDELIPSEFELYQNVPNPFNPTTMIYYDLPENSNVKIIVYNMLGRRIRTLVNQHETAGLKSVVWDSKNNQNYPVPSGVYFYSISTESFTATKKLLLLK